MLGDGRIRYKGHNCRLHIKHAAWQMPLVSYKHQVFKNLTSMKIHSFSQSVKGKEYGFCEFVTRTNPNLTNFYHIFYRNKVKIVPKDIEKLLVDPLSLAIWFMDDGSAEYAGVSFQTHCYSKKDVERLRLCLEKNFHLHATLRQNKGKWILYIPKKDLVKFKSLVGPYVLNLFKYKLFPYNERTTNPVETARRDPVIMGS